MQSTIHLAHIKANQSWNNCSECRADTERRFVQTVPWREYRFVSEYLAYIRPRLNAVATDDSVDARIWYRGFRLALNRRISLRTPSAGRKQCDSYLERLKQFRFPSSKADATYLRSFASRGASCLDA
jgi:hypothetical protein